MIGALERQHLCGDLHPRAPEHIVADLLHGLAQALGARHDIARGDIRAALVVQKRLDSIAGNIEAVSDGGLRSDVR
jgi:hypothetical protein